MKHQKVCENCREIVVNKYGLLLIDYFICDACDAIVCDDCLCSEECPVCGEKYAVG